MKFASLFKKKERDFSDKFDIWPLLYIGGCSHWTGAEKWFESKILSYIDISIRLEEYQN